MKTSTLAILAVVVTSLFFLLKAYTDDYFAAKQADTPIQPLAERYDAAGFSLVDLDGTTVRLSDYRGSTVLIMFWSTS